jgi:hypothetical protein
MKWKTYEFIILGQTLLESGIKTFCMLAIETLSSLQIYKATFFIVWKINLETELVYQKDRCDKQQGIRSSKKEN